VSWALWTAGAGSAVLALAIVLLILLALAMAVGGVIWGIEFFIKTVEHTSLPSSLEGLEVGY
jgi:hypothetical protein